MILMCVMTFCIGIITSRNIPVFKECNPLFVNFPAIQAQEHKKQTPSRCVPKGRSARACHAPEWQGSGCYFLDE